MVISWYEATGFFDGEETPSYCGQALQKRFVRASSVSLHTILHYRNSNRCYCSFPFLPYEHATQWERFKVSTANQALGEKEQTPGASSGSGHISPWFWGKTKILFLLLDPFLLCSMFGLKGMSESACGQTVSKEYWLGAREISIVSSVALRDRILYVSSIQCCCCSDINSSATSACQKEWC